MEKALERMEKIDRPKMENTRMGLQFQQKDRSGEEVVVLEGIAKSFGTASGSWSGEGRQQRQDRLSVPAGYRG